ncbi:MAG: O-antigen ligase family protein [Devosiaceae bacterium]|nr:O-antigen ligase family protein [Devosiaceae bacterium MH13]
MRASGRPGMRQDYALLATAVALSLGRFDPAFVPLEFAGLTANQLLFYAIGVYLTGAVLSHYRGWPPLGLFGSSLLLLGVWAVISSYWSPSGYQGLAKSISYVAVFGAALNFAMRLTTEEIISASRNGALAVVAVCVILALALPNSAGTTVFHDGAWRGVFLQKNVLGRAALILAILCIVSFLCLRGRREVTLALLGSVLAGVALWKSQSLTAIIGLGIFIAALPLLYGVRLAGPRTRLWLGCGAVLCLPFLALLFQPVLELVSDLTDRSATLTGRVPLWEFALSQLSARPWNGFGVEGFFGHEAAAPFQALTGWLPEHAHNGFIDLALEFGLVGLVLFAASFAAFVWNTPRAVGETKVISLFMLAIIILVITMNLTESNLYRSSNTVWLLYTIVGLHAVALRRTIAARSRVQPTRRHTRLPVNQVAFR